jgi:monoterpene epsilon-lactone hydrolase
MDQVMAGEGTLHLEARTVPIPKSLSAEAQKFLATPFPAGEQPPLHDKAAWKAFAAAFDKSFEPMADRILAAVPATVETTTIGGVTVHIATPKTVRHPDWANMSIHGGGWVLLGGKYAIGEAAQNAAQFGCVIYAVDYRMPPDHPYPAAVDDCLSVYREIVKKHDAKKIFISGASAGGNLTGAVTLKLRDAGLKLPGAIAMMTPATDLTQGSDTLNTNNGVDTVLRPVGNMIALYAEDHDRKNPYISPLFGDFTKGFPPTFLQSGTRDLLLSDTVRMHRALQHAGIESELHVWEAMPHGGFGGMSPEDRELRAAFERFIEKHLG